jgi:fatty-acid desaturase
MSAVKPSDRQSVNRQVWRWLLGPGQAEVAPVDLAIAAAVTLKSMSHVTFSINSTCHMAGQRRFVTRD